MELRYVNDKIARLCNDGIAAQRRHGPDCAKKLRRRLADLAAASCLDVMRGLGGDCEELKADRSGQLSLKLAGGKRLVFQPDYETPPCKPDGGLDWRLATKVLIIDVEDYHSG